MAALTMLPRTLWTKMSLSLLPRTVMVITLSLFSFQFVMSRLLVSVVTTSVFLGPVTVTAGYGRTRTAARIGASRRGMGPGQRIGIRQ